jgi:DNA-binding transcriptional LysR family regulator
MKNVDIRQLALLCELMDSQSLSEAASRLNITPSAASQSLTRLRQVLGDELCVRDLHQYQLTPFGKSSLASFREIVALWEGASSTSWAFNPADCDTHVVLSCYDGFGATRLADFYRGVTRLAPRLSLDIRAPANGPQDIAELRAGTVDLLCCHQEPPADAPDLHAETVKSFQISHCCFGVDHPRIANGFSLADYAREEHLLITFLKRAGAQRSPIDVALEQLGLPARRSSVVNSWHLCAEMLACTDRLVSTSEEQAAMLMQLSPRIRSLPLPAGLDWPLVPVFLSWHQRTHHSKPHRWLRMQFRDHLSAGAAGRPFLSDVG